ncbi:MAG: hypothetical protein SO434_06160 [Eubacteriales bacterium]|nr:hypothetical protein [Clostridia bacterium]MDY4592964.1 hypothetical protein [Eubacteriales bacterium]
MKKRLIFHAVLIAVLLLCACETADTPPSSINSGSSSSPESSNLQLHVDTSQEEITYTETDVQEAFARSDAAPNATILDCVVAEDQTMNLMGVVQFLDSEHPKTCWMGFVTTDGFVYSAGPQAKPADDDSLTYLGDGTVSMNMIQEETGETYLFKLTISRTDSGDLCYTSWDSRIQEEAELPES